VVTAGFADLLVGQGVKCIVVDLPLTLDVHNAFLGLGACQVENVIGLDRIRDDKVMLIALPLKIVGIDAAPARVVVIEGM
jgi:arylformamidase